MTGPERRCFSTLRLVDTAAGRYGQPNRCTRMDGHESPHAATTEDGLSLRWWRDES